MKKNKEKKKYDRRSRGSRRNTHWPEVTSIHARDDVVVRRRGGQDVLRWRCRWSLGSGGGGTIPRPDRDERHGRSGKNAAESVAPRQGTGKENVGRRRSRRLGAGSSHAVADGVLKAGDG
ncbi:hypothetical protein M6B38_195850 [Iris pallida]|uniref:Uncharacterized protein n=1 Tax=Iris pallida TaxID=29817 RepID=A0AAX6ECE5_IRIPA|nr:hypothetical protein M6B38_195850 [Iris pallida]